MDRPRSSREILAIAPGRRKGPVPVYVGGGAPAGAPAQDHAARYLPRLSEGASSGRPVSTGGVTGTTGGDVARRRKRSAKHVCVIADSSSLRLPLIMTSRHEPFFSWLARRCSAPTRYQSCFAWKRTPVSEPTRSSP